MFDTDFADCCNGCCIHHLHADTVGPRRLLCVTCD